MLSGEQQEYASHVYLEASVLYRTLDHAKMSVVDLGSNEILEEHGALDTYGFWTDVIRAYALLEGFAALTKR